MNEFINYINSDRKPVVVFDGATGTSFQNLNLKFEKAKLKELKNINVLVAGCGTGQHALTTARKYENSFITALDLSLSSLSYAKRKADELQINSDTRNHANYLQSWIKCLRKDPSILKNSLKEANRARNYILHPKEDKTS